MVDLTVYEARQVAQLAAVPLTRATTELFVFRAPATAK